MKIQILFSGKIRKNISKCHLTKRAKHKYFRRSFPASDSSSSVCTIHLDKNQSQSGSKVHHHNVAADTSGCFSAFWICRLFIYKFF